MSTTVRAPDARYAAYRFRLAWDGRCVAGVTRMSSPAKLIGGTAPARSAPGQLDRPEVVVERGVSYDRSFIAWVSRFVSYSDAGRPGDLSAAIADLCRPLSIELYSAAGQQLIAYRFPKTWVSRFAAVSALDRAGDAIGIDSIVFQHEGCERVTPAAGEAHA